MKDLVEQAKSSRVAQRSSHWSSAAFRTASTAFQASQCSS
ncbi:hypothetical protein BJ973_008005 [Actinoplanes tereljensis]